MRYSVVGTILGIVILFLSIIVLPAYFVGIVNWRDDLNTCQTAARNFVDQVIDNEQITDRALSDLNLSLAGCHSTFTYEYFREEKVTNPDPAHPGQSLTSWSNTIVDDSTVWRQGDIVTIVIEQQGMSLYERLAGAILGTAYSKVSIRLSGMVR